jgi:hypothetical protein
MSVAGAGMSPVKCIHTVDDTTFDSFLQQYQKQVYLKYLSFLEISCSNQINHRLQFELRSLTPDCTFKTQHFHSSQHNDSTPHIDEVSRTGTNFLQGW